MDDAKNVLHAADLVFSDDKLKLRLASIRAQLSELTDGLDLSAQSHAMPQILAPLLADLQEVGRGKSLDNENYSTFFGICLVQLWLALVMLAD